jgi:transposase-like protein
MANELELSQTGDVISESREAQVVSWYLIFRDKLKQLHKSKKGRGFDLDDKKIVDCAITAAENYTSIQEEQARKVAGGKVTPTLDTKRFKNIIVPVDGTDSEKEAIARVARYCILMQDMELKKQERQEWEATRPRRIKAYFEPSKGLVPEIGIACAVGGVSVGIYSAAVGVGLVTALSGPIGWGLLAGVAMLAFCAIQIGKYWRFEAVLSQEAKSQDEALANLEKAVVEIEGSVLSNLYRENLDKFYRQREELGLSFESKKDVHRSVRAEDFAHKRAKSLPMSQEQDNTSASKKRSASHEGLKNSSKVKPGKI